ncbi:NAD(+) diphosphatase, partial [Coprococcus eutactus]|nr:NAD(+) diphosphatase [Coprococcus eutactus]
FHDMGLSFSEKMIFAIALDDENLLGFMTYGVLQNITGCDRKIGNLVYLFSIHDTAYFLWNGDNRLTEPGYD